MREVMSDDYDAWLAAQDAPLFRALRLNPRKISVDAFLREFPDAKRIEGYPAYLYHVPTTDVSLGNHPFHHAGCFYLQEPSASLVVEALDIRENENVLDCCAAPGGKSTQILSKLNGTGILVSNEIDPKRNQTLRFNLQRFGEDNLLITQNDTKTLGESFIGYFDKIVVDAPCSGMGMYRKDPSGMKYFSTNNILHCARMQEEILENVYPSLKEGGVLVYSTCTFAKEENEERIHDFMRKHPDMVIEDVPFSIGRKGFGDLDENLEKCRRITVLEGGEGHFICRMRKHGKQETKQPALLQPVAVPLIRNFVSMFLDESIRSYIIHDKINLSRHDLPCPSKINVVQAGVYLGEKIQDRIEIDHAFASSQIAQTYFKQKIELGDEETLRFLHGDTIDIEGVKGYVLIGYRGKTYGLGKGDGRQIKNKFPKGIRIFQKFSENK